MELNVKEERLRGYPWRFIEKKLRRVLGNGLRHQASLEHWDMRPAGRGKRHPPGDGTDPTLHVQTVAGEAQKFFLTTHRHTAGSPILPGLNCSGFLPVVLFLVKIFTFPIRKIWLEKCVSNFYSTVVGAFREG